LVRLVPIAAGLQVVSALFCSVEAHLDDVDRKSINIKAFGRLNVFGGKADAFDLRDSLAGSFQHYTLMLPSVRPAEQFRYFLNIERPLRRHSFAIASYLSRCHRPTCSHARQRRCGAEADIGACLKWVQKAKCSQRSRVFRCFPNRRTFIRLSHPHGYLLDSRRRTPLTRLRRGRHPRVRVQ
jgi:hypothetical protein